MCARARACMHVCTCVCVWVCNPACRCRHVVSRHRPQTLGKQEGVYFIASSGKTLGDSPGLCSAAQPSCLGGASPTMQFFKSSQTLLPGLSFAVTGTLIWSQGSASVPSEEGLQGEVTFPFSTSLSHHCPPPLPSLGINTEYTHWGQACALGLCAWKPPLLPVQFDLLAPVSRCPVTLLSSLCGEP